jgi:hypothetical protein
MRGPQAGRGLVSKTLFHYTPIFRAVMIVRDGVIRRSSGKTPPYVWLSSNTTNEPTAARAIPSMEQTLKCNGPALFAGARFVFHDCDATSWADLQLTSDVRRNLKQLAKPKGGQPKEWFALDADVPSASLPLEIEDETGAWREIAHDNLKRRHEEFLGVTRAVSGRLSFHMRRRPLSLPQP